MNLSPATPAIATEVLDDEFWVRLVGEVDCADRHELRCAVGSARAGCHGDIVVDLSAATFIDCSVLTLVMGLSTIADAHGGHVRVVGACPLARKVLGLGGVSCMLHLDPADA